MTIPCTDAITVTRAGDTVHVELPGGDKLELGLGWRSMRRTSWKCTRTESRWTKPRKRKDARQAEAGRVRP